MKDIEFYLYFKKDLLAHVVVRDDIVTVENFTKNRIFNPFLIDNVTTKTVMHFFNNRCFDPTRPDKKELLDRLGLDSYNSIEICKKTHGLMAEDYCWIKFKDEDIDYDKLFN